MTALAFVMGSRLVMEVVQGVFAVFVVYVVVSILAGWPTDAARRRGRF